MILYRLAKCIYINDFSGLGAQRYGGRWNSIGQPMLYLTESRSLAILEVLVHLSPTIIPGNYCMAEFEVPGDSIQNLTIDELPHNWQDVSPTIGAKKLGDTFIKQQRHLLLKVPSAIVPEEFNYLLNPLHPSASKLKLIKQQTFSFDERLV